MKLDIIFAPVPFGYARASPPNDSKELKKISKKHACMHPISEWITWATKVRTVIFLLVVNRTHALFALDQRRRHEDCNIILATFISSNFFASL